MLIVLARPVASNHCGHAHVLANLTLINRRHNDHKGATHFAGKQVVKYFCRETESAFSVLVSEEKTQRCWIRCRGNAYTRRLPNRRTRYCDQTVADGQTRARRAFDRRIDDSGVDFRSGSSKRSSFLGQTSDRRQSAATSILHSLLQGFPGSVFRDAAGWESG